MPWVKDEFRYSKFLLKRIAKSYEHIYDRIVLDSYTLILDGYHVERERVITGVLNLIEYKADFDRALEQLGHSRYPSRAPKLDLTKSDFKDYRKCSRLQQLIIADILGIPDEELVGFYDIPRLRGYAYSLMVRYLNSAQ